jgi:hypothetical protein
MTGSGGDPEPDDLSLADVLEAAAEDLVGVQRAIDGPMTTWTVGATPFAVLSDGVAEFRLDPLVAAAALRTPDTRPSARGAEWVAFAPAMLDDGAVDRAEAWFLSAHRRLTPARAN